MSLLSFLAKLPQVLSIAANVLEVVEQVQELDDDNKPKTDERGKAVLKKTTRQVKPEEVFDYKVAAATGEVRAVTRDGKRASGKLKDADLKKAIAAAEASEKSEG